MFHISIGERLLIKERVSEVFSFSLELKREIIIL